VIALIAGEQVEGAMDHRACRIALLMGSVALASPTMAIGQSATPVRTDDSPIAGPDMLGTRAVPIRADRFSASLKRAREDASASPLLRRLIAPARLLPPLQKIAFVQRAVTASIHWISDTTEWGQHDYWASASQTLARGAGDGEDRAIVKIQALRALGFTNSDLFLTLGRDRVGGPIAVLTVRRGNQYYLVDDDGAPPLLAEQRRLEFQPIMSFGMYGAWVHVPRMAPPILAAAKPAGSTIARK
jgi:predicted transglutaminase-like cysteine proteinase